MKKETILKSVEKKIKLITSEKHFPKEFFQNRKGLYVWNSFFDNIVKNAKTTEANYDFGYLSSFDFKKYTTDEQTEKALPKKHIFSETEVCAVIANLIEKQPKGEEGVLQNNGYFNLFYTPSHVVGVCWSGDEWDVGGWSRDFLSWDEGRRIFSPATES